MRTRAWCWASAVAVLYTALSVGTAAAHGSVENPVSRAEACGTAGGAAAGTPACRAAIAASGPKAATEWDNIRIANVRGRDRETIPSGKLCSAGLRDYAGLDLARPDWPNTALKTSQTEITYRATIPHKGTFRLYLTKDGYRPSAPLQWADLEETPFLTATDPPLENGAYVLSGKLPAGKTGRHVLYTIWQNSDTPDTYYSCSDITVAVPDAAAGTAAGAGKATPVAQVDRLASLDLGTVVPLGIGLVGVAVVGAALFWRRGNT